MKSKTEIIEKINELINETNNLCDSLEINNSKTFKDNLLINKLKRDISAKIYGKIMLEWVIKK